MLGHHVGSGDQEVVAGGRGSEGRWWVADPPCGLGRFRMRVSRSGLDRGTGGLGRGRAGEEGGGIKVWWVGNPSYEPKKLLDLFDFH